MALMALPLIASTLPQPVTLSLFLSLLWLSTLSTATPNTATYHEYREQEWPFGELWGDRENRTAVRDYLKKIWEENNVVPTVQYTLENVRKERDLILNWWWTARYNRSGTYRDDRSFGEWLLAEYNDAQKLSYQDNRQRGRLS